MAGMWIGEPAGRSGVPHRSIRFYEERGLLPEPARTSSGYRDYGPQTIEWLRLIRAAKGLGLTLEEIGWVLELADAGEQPYCWVPPMIAAKLVEIERLMEELAPLQEKLLSIEGSEPLVGGAICPIIEGSPLRAYVSAWLVPRSFGCGDWKSPRSALVAAKGSDRADRGANERRVSPPRYIPAQHVLAEMAAFGHRRLKRLMPGRAFLLAVVGGGSSRPGPCSRSCWPRRKVAGLEGRMCMLCSSA